MQVEVVSFNAPTSTGLQTITSPELGSLVPKAVFFSIVGSDVFDDSDGHSKLGFGTADGTRQWAAAGRSENGVGTTDTSRRTTTSKCILIENDGAATIDGEAGFDAFVAGGVRVNWTNAPGDDYKIIAIFFAGDDVSAHANWVQVPTEDVPVDVTDPGFRPKTIIAVTTGDKQDDTDTVMNLSIGAAVDNGTGYDQKCWAFEDDHGVGTTDIESIQSADRICGEAGSLWMAEVSDPDASGFSITPRLRSPANDFVLYLALKFDSEAAVFDFDPPTSTGNASVTGLGFQPQAVVLGGTSNTARSSTTETTNQDANCHTFSAFTPDDEYSNCIQNEDGVGTSSTNSLPTNRAYEMYGLTSTSVANRLHRATFVSMDPSGFTLNYTHANGTQRRGWGLAFGPDEVDAQGQVSWTEFECPDLDAECQVSWAELECPDPAGAAQISYTVLQVPDEECCFPPDGETNKQLNLSWAELETPDVAPDAEVNLGWAEFAIPDVPVGGGDSKGQIGWAELITPNVNTGGTQGAGQISWAQLVTPDAEAIQVSSLELEIPDPLRRGRVAWARVEFQSVAEDNRVEKIVLKDINRELFLEELAVYDIAPDRGFFLPGFDPKNPQPEYEPPGSDPQRVWTPMTEFSRRQFGETVERGEMWLDYSFRLTEEDRFHLLLVCHEHDATQRTSEQEDNDQFFEDITILNDYNLRCDTLSDIERDDMMCRLLRFTMARVVETRFRRVHNEPVDQLEENELDEPFE